jgi:hypothetical protein
MERGLGTMLGDATGSFKYRLTGGPGVQEFFMGSPGRKYVS